MMDHFIRQDDSGLSGFFLRDDKALLKRLECARQASKKVILWGVSFALLDLAERHSLDLSACIVMETGGMKGRRKEWVRSELHSYLQQRLNVSSIHSEYGMTELMSQAYSTRDGLYQCPPSMRVLVRDINDPFSGVVGGRAGVIQIIDLANANTCSFIETEDLGRLSEVSGFEILGRLDNSDVRGCNLMIT